uniref:Uncharacterized protein n=1 Tax=Trypanosoma vivax (strain Y486) TaxID=1055687 RepID=G0TXL8_TRYVY|nr:hypothetical protein TVY486_0700520 [Trypanosoma vivax Y486]
MWSELFASTFFHPVILPHFHSLFLLASIFRCFDYFSFSFLLLGYLSRLSGEFSRTFADSLTCVRNKRIPPGRFVFCTVDLRCCVLLYILLMLHSSYGNPLLGMCIQVGFALKPTA